MRLINALSELGMNESQMKWKLRPQFLEQTRKLPRYDRLILRPASGSIKIPSDISHQGFFLHPVKSCRKRPRLRVQEKLAENLNEFIASKEAFLLESTVDLITTYLSDQESPSFDGTCQLLLPLFAII
jgi:hypothetical protein